jgi:predicted RNA-binding protein with PUA-like domain
MILEKGAASGACVMQTMDVNDGQAMAHWIFKTEPHEYSIDDLASAGDRGAPWDGIRNYQARNLLRDHVALGDEVLIYHSSCKVPGIAGSARISRAAYADPDQFDASSPYYDAKATRETPRWYRVDLVFVEKFNQPVPLALIKDTPSLADMMLLRQPRLSIQPVTALQWQQINVLAAHGD